MVALPDFERVFGLDSGTLYTQQIIDQIEKHRDKLQGTLFFDRLLGTMNLQQVISIYPPRSNADLHKLFAAIASAASPIHHKQSVLYYMLLDLAVPTRSAAAFARDALLPPKYATLIDGLWALDQLEFEQALTSLTAPSLIPTFAEETLLLLCRNASDSRGRDLALGYYEVISPEIKSQHVMDRVFRTMCSAGITEAFFYAKIQANTMHRRFFELLVFYILDELSGDEKSIAASELVSLPLTNEEEHWLTEFLESGPGHKLSGAEDVLTVRKLLNGQNDQHQ